MANSFFRFRQFTVHQDRCAMKVTTDACLFGAWCADKLKNDEATHGLDVGAGTGLVSLLVAQQTAAAIDAVEIEENAATQATENVAASPWSERIAVINADILTWPSNRLYDFVVSNPPFYENEISSKRVEVNLAHHGLGLQLSRLLEAARYRLKTDGRLFLLLPAKREKEIIRLVASTGFHMRELVYVAPSTGHKPFRFLLEAALVPGQLSVSTLAIKNEDNEYTEGFKGLLKDYYLFL